jgi:hypothetical protein
MQVTVLQPFHSRMPVAICPSAHPLNTARTQRLRNACVGDKRPGCECETEPSAPVPPPDGSVEGQTQQKRTRWHQHKRTRWHQQKEDTLASTEEDTLASTAEQLARHLPLGVVGTRCPPLPSPALLEHISARAQHKATETDAPRSQGWGAAVGSGARRHAPRAIPISMRAAAHTGSP